MKSISKIILLLTLTIFTKNFAQLDTLNYLKTFEANKANYIGQPFIKILNDITQLQPKLALSIPNSKSKSSTSRTRFKFVDIQHSFNRVVILEVIWQTPINRINTKYYEQLNHGNFTNDEKNFYGTKIVKDLKVYK